MEFDLLSQQQAVGDSSQTAHPRWHVACFVLAQPTDDVTKNPLSPALLNLQHSGIARMVGRENHKKRAHTAVYGFQFLSLLCSLVLITLSSN